MSVTIRELLTKWVFGADTDKVEKFEKAIEKAKHTAKLAAATITGVTTAAGAAGAKLFHLTEGIAEHADEIGKASARTGINVQLLQELKAVAAKTEVSFGGLVRGMKTFAIASEAARKGGKAQKEAFRELGVSLRDNKGKVRDNNAVMLDSLLAISQIEDSNKRLAVAQKLLGRTAFELMPLFEEGPKAIAEMFDEANRSGKVLGATTIEQGDKMDKELRALRGTANLLKMQFGSALMPAVSEVVTRINAWVKSNRGLIGQKLQEIARRIAEALREVMKQAEKANLFDKLTSAVKGFVDLVSWLLRHTEAVSWFFKIFIAGAAISKLAPAIGLVTSAFGALRWAIFRVPILGWALAAGAAAYGIIKNWGEVKELFSTLWKGGKAYAQDFFDYLKDKIYKVVDWFEDVAISVGDKFGWLLPGAKEGANLLKASRTLTNAANAQSGGYTTRQLSGSVMGGPNSFSPFMGMGPLSVVNNITLQPGTTAGQASRVADSAEAATKKSLRRAYPSVKP